MRKARQRFRRTAKLNPFNGFFQELLGNLSTKSGIELKKFYKALLNHLGENCAGRIREIYQGATSNIDEHKNLEKIIANIDALDWYSARRQRKSRS